ncbi:MAG TPA: hypothetical protein PKK26_03905 [Candidatus Wallbacteria bacterium]|nr:hypothetical protein [Candidatus Wallbacteria bacterium]
MKKMKFMKKTKKDERFGNFSLIFKQRAFAIPLVIFLSVVLMIFAFMLVQSNTQSKKQRNATISTTKAYFMALAGLQQFKLKYKLLPEQLFKSSCMYYGYSPFYIPPGGAAFDQFSAANQSKTGKRYPEFVANFVEDINSYETDPDGSASGGKTSSGGKPIVKVPVNVTPTGGYKTWNFKIGGFALDDPEARDTIEEWGYKIVDVKLGSLKKESNPGADRMPYIEQSITIDIEGKSKSNVGGLAKDETGFNKFKVTETILLKREIRK